MNYSVFIDQIFAVKHDLNLSRAAVFSFIINSLSWTETIVINKTVWYFVSRTKVVQELPIVSKRPDTIYRHFRALEDAGLINYKKIDGRDYVRVTEKGNTWNRKSGKISEHSEKNPNELGKKSGSNSEKNPTDKVIRKDKVIKDNTNNNARENSDPDPVTDPSKKKKSSAKKRKSKTGGQEKAEIRSHVAGTRPNFDDTGSAGGTDAEEKTTPYSEDMDVGQIREELFAELKARGSYVELLRDAARIKTEKDFYKQVDLFILKMYDREPAFRKNWRNFLKGLAGWIMRSNSFTNKNEQNGKQTKKGKRGEDYDDAAEVYKTEDWEKRYS